jgi:DNA-binding beta-propeller fold protein YncE
MKGIMGLKPLLRAIGLLMVITFSAGAASVAAPDAPEDADHIKAPDFTGADNWLNTDKDQPLSINGLKGQVVLLDFWTYACVNCMHVFSDLHYIEHKYHDQPVVVIGVHSGKFDQEKDTAHIRAAVLRNNITHPVAVDNEFRIWNAYGVQAWPTLVLIDPEGNVVGAWSGEGHRNQIDRKIDQLLADGRARGALAKPLHFTPEKDLFNSGFLQFPSKVLADAASHRLFIADTGHNRILVADLDGKVRQVIGSGDEGPKDGAFREAQFHQPQGLALSDDGRTLYVADTENHAIRAADLSSGTLTTIAGNGSQAHEMPDDDSPAKDTPLSSPWALARVGSRLYIAMAGVHQIWAMDLNRMTISHFAGAGREGNNDSVNSRAWFAQPSGLTSDGTHLYVADSESSSIRSVDLGGEGQTHTIAGSGDLFGFGRTDGPGHDARFQHPLGVALSGETLFVADTFNNVIRAIDLKTNQVSTWYGSGKTDSGSPAAPNLFEPGGLTVAANTLYIADTNHHRIVAVDIATKKARVVAEHN